MDMKNKKNSGQPVQFLFTMLLFFVLTVCSVFTISIGAKVYKNIDARMNENFTETTALSYISNKVKQADESGAISILTMENIQLLKIEQEYYDVKYDTLIYFKDGNINELFVSKDSQYTLDDGVRIMEGKGLSFSMLENNLLKVETTGENGNSISLALRSEDGRYE
jgi:hypothetical protein